MKTRSADSKPEQDDKAAAPVKKEPASPTKKRGREAKADESEQEEEQPVKAESKPKSSPRKKPKTEGVSDVGDLPPKVFGTPSGKDAERKHGVLEQGSLYFIYRPKVELTEVHESAEIAHFHFILMPFSPSNTYRLITIGRNLLPRRTESKGKRPDITWAKLLDVSDDLSTLKERLGPRTYETKTKGTRHIAPARVAGAGHYIIHSTQAKDTPKASKNMSMVYKTVLAYALKTPHELGKVQKDLSIEKEGSFQFQIKDPKSKSTNAMIRDLPASKQPQFPKSLTSLFTTKFIPVNPVSLLNYSGAELLLLPSHASVEEEVGEEAEGEMLAAVGSPKGKGKGKGKKKDAEESDDEALAGGEGGHEEATEVLRTLGLTELVEGKALEGYWE